MQVPPNGPLHKCWRPAPPASEISSAGAVDAGTLQEQGSTEDETGMTPRRIAQRIKEAEYRLERRSNETEYRLARRSRVPMSGVAPRFSLLKTRGESIRGVSFLNSGTCSSDEKRVFS